MRTHFAATLAAFSLFATLGDAAHADVLYDNAGPSTHIVDGLNVSGFEMSNSFVLAADSLLTGINFDAHNFVGEVATSLNWAILDDSPQFAGATLFSGSGTLSNVFIGASAVTAAWDLNAYSFALPSLALNAGTYWFKLGVTDAVPTYWDQSGGPSLGYHSAAGAQASNTFQVIGTAAVPEPASWALLILGFGAMGLALRGRRPTVVA
jgi:hypothetical protein